MTSLHPRDSTLGRAGTPSCYCGWNGEVGLIQLAEKELLRLEGHLTRLRELYYTAIYYDPGADASSEDMQRFIDTVGAFNAHLGEVERALFGQDTL